MKDEDMHNFGGECERFRKEEISKKEKEERERKIKEQEERKRREEGRLEIIKAKDENAASIS